MMDRKYLYLGGGLLVLAGLLYKGRRYVSNIPSLFPEVFKLLRQTFGTVEEWAAARGREIRAAFGITPDDLKPEGSIRPTSMSLEEWNRRKLGTLNPSWRPKFEAFFTEAQSVAKSHGAKLIIWDAARSLERQLDLYKKGRTEGGSIVTKTIASRHMFGLAIDILLQLENGFPNFDSHPGWYTKEILPLATKHGLQSLYLTKGIDKPHIEAPLDDLPVIASVSSQIRKDFPGLA